MDELAGHAGLSPRQLRRVFVERTGVGPKHFCRILRFRRAEAIGKHRAEWAAVAAECGSFDQSHLIRDFREFAGRTPR